jgi:hypothetical protein
MLFCYVWHFLPEVITDKMKWVFDNTPLIAKSNVILGFVYWIVYATAVAGSQPFIYFPILRNKVQSDKGTKGQRLLFFCAFSFLADLGDIADFLICNLKKDLPNLLNLRETMNCHYFVALRQKTLCLSAFVAKTGL